jgi:UDP-N-acetylmuramate dehydrogenase
VIDDIMQQLLCSVPGLNVKTNEPMSRHTTFRIGGPADLWCRPNTIDELIETVQFATNKGIPFQIIGNGSNLLVRDGGIRGLVIETTALNRIADRDDNVIEVECGVSLSDLVLYAMERSFTGLEFAYGIPGTVGGAVYMNAGAYGGEMKNCVIETDYIDSSGNIHTLAGDEHRFCYRGSFFTEHPECVILRTRLKLSAGDKEKIQECMSELMGKREASQPLQYPSAGSFFKRPKGYYAGKLISDSELRGARCGDAEVSQKHAGFIINAGNANCSDVLCLMETVQSTVKKRFGVDLEPEVKIIGEEK